MAWKFHPLSSQTQATSMCTPPPNNQKLESLSKWYLTKVRWTLTCLNWIMDYLPWRTVLCKVSCQDILHSVTETSQNILDGNPWIVLDVSGIFLHIFGDSLGFIPCLLWLFLNFLITVGTSLEIAGIKFWSCSFHCDPVTIFNLIPPYWFFHLLPCWLICFWWEMTDCKC